jgi:hypothetical protein
MIEPNVSTYFHKRVVHLANVHFAVEELNILHRGPKFNFSLKPKSWLKTPALAVDSSISLLKEGGEEYKRHLAANNTCTKTTEKQNNQIFKPQRRETNHNILVNIFRK